MNFSTTREHGSLEYAEPIEKENKITGNIIGAAIDVHRILRPGLLESAYEACLIEFFNFDLIDTPIKANLKDYI